MTTDPYNLYVAIAQIAAAFAGFGSLASSLGPRAGTADSRVDANRLSLMLATSLSATLLGLLPALLGVLVMNERLSLGLASVIALLVIFGHAPTFIRRVIAIRDAEGFSAGAAIVNAGFLVIAITGFGLCAVGLPSDRLAALYLLGLTGMLASAAIMFSRVILSLLRPFHD